MPKKNIKEIENLLKNIKDGDTIAFEKLLNLKTPNLQIIARNLLHDDMLSEDVISEAFFALSKICYKFNTDEELNRWLKTVVINKCYNVLRQRKKELYLGVDKIDYIIDNSDSIDSKYALQIHIRNCLLALSENEQKVLTYFSHGYTIKEMAKMLDMTISQIRTLLANARTNYIALYQKE